MIVRRVVPVLTVSELEPTVRLFTEIMGFEVVMDHGWIVTLADPADMSKQLSVMTRDGSAAVNRVSRWRSSMSMLRTGLRSSAMLRSSIR